MPCSYCRSDGASPTEAKWPFIVMTEGAFGYLEVAEGRREEPLVLGVGDDILAWDSFGDCDVVLNRCVPWSRKALVG